ncbi:MAG TPA: hypothetical protein VMW72_25465, partial [Sedimentisphaerales bacterium]|nr:hypothetical protein [Sedimentisphaerales bacterium]
YYSGCNTPTNTQSSLTNKALLIKYFIVFSLTKSRCFLINKETLEVLRTVVQGVLGTLFLVSVSLG